MTVAQFGSHPSSDTTHSSATSTKLNVMKYVKNDSARATEIPAIDIEWSLMAECEGWIKDNTDQAGFDRDYDRESFFNALWHEIDVGCGEIWSVYTDLNVDIERQVDGTYKVFAMEELRQENRTG